MTKSENFYTAHLFHPYFELIKTRAFAFAAIDNVLVKESVCY